jgi:hypothetical protein
MSYILSWHPVARTSSSRIPASIWIAVFTLLSWLGLAFHNRADLPQLSAVSPESSVPALISVLLLCGVRLSPWGRMMRLALLSWACVNLLAGGILSVVPFPFLPFHPEQTLFHYLMHVQYVVSQVPLIVVLLQLERTTGHQNRRS